MSDVLSFDDKRRIEELKAEQKRIKGEMPDVPASKEWTVKDAEKWIDRKLKRLEQIDEEIYYIQQSAESRHRTKQSVKELNHPLGYAYDIIQERKRQGLGSEPARLVEVGNSIFSKIVVWPLNIVVAYKEFGFYTSPSVPFIDRWNQCAIECNDKMEEHAKHDPRWIFRKKSPEFSSIELVDSNGNRRKFMISEEV